MGNPDDWLETIRKCEYLPEHDMKKLCEMVRDPCAILDCDEKPKQKKSWPFLYWLELVIIAFLLFQYQHACIDKFVVSWKCISAKKKKKKKIEKFRFTNMVFC
jgi:hypothetical protein